VEQTKAAAIKATASGIPSLVVEAKVTAATVPRRTAMPQA